MTTSAHLPPLSDRRHSREGPRQRTLARVLAALSVVPAVLAITATPAHAASPRCNYVMSITLGTSTTATVPAHDSGGSRTWRCITKYGDGFQQMNYAVLQLQDTMNLCYRNEIGDRWPLSTDGKFGGNTRTALIRVQRSLRVSADGEYGPQTATAMNHWTAAYTPYGIFYTCHRIPGV